MSHPLAGVPATQIKDMPGVRDLTPPKARMSFALALKSEAEGDHAKAAERLAQAVEAEQG